MNATESDLNVSRETTDDLQTYHDMLLQWTKTINLISPTTASDAWRRHIVDSAQIFHLVPVRAENLVDLGSGGGLPGIVVAIMAKAEHPDLTIKLVESDQRKAAFLRSVIRTLNLNAHVAAERIEALQDVRADVITARALAPLSHLLQYAKDLLVESGVAILHKGRNVDTELSESRTVFHFDCMAHPSATDPDARILEIRNIRNAAA